MVGVVVVVLVGLASAFSRHHLYNACVGKHEKSLLLCENSCEFVRSKPGGGRGSVGVSVLPSPQR